MPQDRQTLVIEHAEQLLTAQSRRGFLRAIAAGGTAIFLPTAFAACGDDDDVTAPGVTSATLDFAAIRGIPNYLYALEQVTAAFYVRAVQESLNAGFNAVQRRHLTDIRNHEFIHREALRAYLTVYRLPELRLDGDFNGTRFNDRMSVLEAARDLEDLTVSAYNHAGQYVTDPAELLLIGKIASVEGRHSAVVRDLIDELGAEEGRLFAGDDIVDSNGLDSKDQPATPTAILAAFDPFLGATISVANPPA
jgi:hypothetical protein